jgi:hypothetical protein
MPVLRRPSEPAAVTGEVDFKSPIANQGLIQKAHTSIQAADITNYRRQKKRMCVKFLLRIGIGQKLPPITCPILLEGICKIGVCVEKFNRRSGIQQKPTLRSCD